MLGIRQKLDYNHQNVINTKDTPILKAAVQDNTMWFSMSVEYNKI